jgi:23S rRNA pseudouridine2457 synthase
MSDYFIIHKPYKVLSQFSPEEGKKVLKDFFDVPADLYPVGRLDYDSEGLLILTNDKQLNHALLNPLFKHEKEYWVQVEGEIDPKAIDELQQGVVITVDGKWYKTKPCRAEKFPAAPVLAERNPPVRFRKNIPTSWIRVILSEGKNRQIRKMTAKIGFPTLRLFRYRIEKLTLEGMEPGEMRRISKESIYPLLGIEKKKAKNGSG